jgi:hypothetical protein
MTESPDLTPAPAPAPPSLEEQVRSLRAWFRVTLVALLGLSAGVNLFFFRQVSLVRRELEAARAVVQEYQKVKEPLMNTFVGNLQVYASTHPDFVPVLDKYQIPVGTALPPATVAPAKGKATK